MSDPTLPTIMQTCLHADWTTVELLAVHVLHYPVISSYYIMAILTRSFCLLLVTVVTVSQVEANIFSDVLSWVGLGGSEKVEEEVPSEDVESGEPAADEVEAELPDENVIIDDGEAGEAVNNEASEEEAEAGRTEEL